MSKLKHLHDRIMFVVGYAEDLRGIWGWIPQRWRRPMLGALAALLITGPFAGWYASAQDIWANNWLHAVIGLGFGGGVAVATGLLVARIGVPRATSDEDDGMFFAGVDEVKPDNRGLIEKVHDGTRAAKVLQKELTGLNQDMAAFNKHLPKHAAAIAKVQSQPDPSYRTLRRVYGRAGKRMDTFSKRTEDRMPVMRGALPDVKAFALLMAENYPAYPNDNFPVTAQGIVEGSESFVDTTKGTIEAVQGIRAVNVSQATNEASARLVQAIENAAEIYSEIGEMGREYLEAVAERLPSQISQR